LEAIVVRSQKINYGYQMILPSFSDTFLTLSGHFRHFVLVFKLKDCASIAPHSTLFFLCPIRLANMAAACFFKPFPIVQTSLFLAQKQPFFWTVNYFKGDCPTSMTKDFPVGVVAFNPVSSRQNCSWAALRLGC
jgi:hypothetical protein